jgi:hypothetical protein
MRGLEVEQKSSHYYLQTHIDTWSTSKQNKKRHCRASVTDIPDGINHELFEIFEKFGLGDKMNSVFGEMLNLVAFREHEL